MSQLAKTYELSKKIKKYGNQMSVFNPVNHQQIRVFLSSTFKDMNQERDYLTKYIFPKITQLAQQHGIDFIVIDLRWGVTEEEANDGQVIHICLEEIDRCRPFFIGFIGERYGWIPNITDVGNYEELKNLFPSIEQSLQNQKSLTEIEILHGVLESQDIIHAFFYQRSPIFTRRLVNELAITDYYEELADKKEKLQALKQRIQQSHHQMTEYQDLAELGQFVYQHFEVLLNRYFPHQHQNHSALDKQRISHRSYASHRSIRYLPNPKAIQLLNQYLEDAQQARDLPPLLITGASGIGKSALLSHWVSLLQKQKPHHQLLIEHYCGINGENRAEEFISRLILELRYLIGQKNQHSAQESEEASEAEEQAKENLPESLYLLTQQLMEELSMLPEDEQLLLVIDAINQIDHESLEWLPKHWPAQVIVVLSVKTGAKANELMERGYLTYHVESLSEDDRMALIQGYLSHYRKKLSNQQLIKISRAKACENPLFLTTILSELQIFGCFEKLDDLIDSYLQLNQMEELFDRVLERLEHDYGLALTQKSLVMLYCSRYGLSENELIALNHCSRLKLSPLLLALDKHLMTNHGLFYFAHDYLKNAVKMRYLSDPLIYRLNQKELATALQQLPFSIRKAEELPWLLANINALDELKACLVDREIFQSLYESNPYELLHYWLMLVKQSSLKQAYFQLIKDQGIDLLGDLQASEAEIKLVAQICGFLELAGDSRHLVAAREWILRQREQALGLDHPQTINAINKLGQLLKTKGLYQQAEPLLQQALTLRERLLGLSHPDTIQSMKNLGKLFEAKGEKEWAESLLRQALVFSQRELGLNHPKSIQLMNHLADLLKSIGHIDEAEQLLREALEKGEKIFGKNHPKIISFLNHLGKLLKLKGEYLSAEQLTRQAIQISEAALGKRHPKTITLINSLGKLLEAQGQYDTAEELSQKAFEMALEVLGEEHPKTISLMTQLGQLFLFKGNFVKAEAFLKNAIQMFSKTIGEKHPKTITVYEQLAWVLILQKKSAETRHISLFLSQHSKKNGAYEYTQMLLALCDLIDGHPVKDLLMLIQRLEELFGKQHDKVKLAYQAYHTLVLNQ